LRAHWRRSDDLRAMALVWLCETKVVVLNFLFQHYFTANSLFFTSVKKANNIHGVFTISLMCNPNSSKYTLVNAHNSAYARHILSSTCTRPYVFNPSFLAHSKVPSTPPPPLLGVEVLRCCWEGASVVCALFQQKHENLPTAIYSREIAVAWLHRQKKCRAVMISMVEIAYSASCRQKLP
jgi:hypothetical protein